MTALIRKQWGMWLLIFNDGHYRSFRTWREAVAEFEREREILRHSR